MIAGSSLTRRLLSSEREGQCGWRLGGFVRCGGLCGRSARRRCGPPGDVDAEGELSGWSRGFGRLGWLLCGGQVRGWSRCVRCRWVWVAGEVVEFAEVSLDESGAAGFLEEGSGGSVSGESVGVGVVGHGGVPGVGELA